MCGGGGGGAVSTPKLKFTFHLLNVNLSIPVYTVQPAQVRNLMKCPYFFIIGRFGDFLS